MIAGADPVESDPLRGTAARRMLPCEAVDTPALIAFRDAWFEEIYG